MGEGVIKAKDPTLWHWLCFVSLRLFPWITSQHFSAWHTGWVLTQNWSNPGKVLAKALKGSVKDLTYWYHEPKLRHGNYLRSFNDKHTIELSQKHYNYIKRYQWYFMPLPPYHFEFCSKHSLKDIRPNRCIKTRKLACWSGETCA